MRPRFFIDLSWGNLAESSKAFRGDSTAGCDDRPAQRIAVTAFAAIVRTSVSRLVALSGGRGHGENLLIHGRLCPISKLFYKTRAIHVLFRHAFSMGKVDSSQESIWRMERCPMEHENDDTAAYEQNAFGTPATVP